jgi:hypothetical protein
VTPEPPAGMTRRTFLAATGGLAVAASIGWNELLGDGVGATEAARNTALSPLVLSSDLYASPAPQRFVFGIAKGPSFASGPPARVAFVPPGVKGSARVDVLPTRLYKHGLPKGRGIYVTDAVFDVAGVWSAVVLTRGKKVPFAIQVNESAVAPVVGAPASLAPSPTKAQPLGVHPICSRRPQCPLHTVSLSDVIGKGKPVAVIFATPALCTSQYCGPVLDELLGVRARYESAGMVFVHVEIWKSNKGATRAPTVAAWGIETDPWLYTVDKAGRITRRLDGAMAREEIVAALDALAAAP